MAVLHIEGIDGEPVGEITETGELLFYGSNPIDYDEGDEWS